MRSCACSGARSSPKRPSGTRWKGRGCTCCPIRSPIPRSRWPARTRRRVCGTPDGASALIERLQAKQGEFGVFLQQAHNWADWEATKRSYELYARYVMPHFSKLNAARAASYQWCGDNRDEFSAKRVAAAKAMFDKHEAETRAAREETGVARPARGREAW